MDLPRLIVVTGRPGAGKTTLAHRLARTIRCPAMCRDEFKEGLVNTFQPSSVPDDLANRQVYDTFFDAITLLLRNGITLVSEAAFQHKLWIPKLEPLQEIAQIRLVICSIDPTLGRARCVQRSLADPERERYHGDPVLQAFREGIELPMNNYEPPRLAVPTLNVDTSDGYHPRFEKIAEFAIQPIGNTFDGSHA